MTKTPLDYQRPSPPRDVTERTLVFWGVYVSAAIVGFRLVGVSAWKVFGSGRGPDISGVELLLMGVAVATVLVAVVLGTYSQRLTRSMPRLIIAAIVLGACSSLPGIVLALLM